MTVPSAYMITLEKLMHDGRSLIHNIYNTGPRMLPCGTPFPTATGRDKLFPNDTTCLMLCGIHLGEPYLNCAVQSFELRL